MAGNGFKWRNNPDALEDVRRRYCNEGESAPQIAQAMGLTQTQVEYAIRHYGMVAGSAPACSPGEGKEQDPPVPADIRALMAENARLSKELERAQDATAAICSVFREAITPLPAVDPLPPPASPPSSFGPHVAVALLSDLQCGTYVESRDVMGLGGFSTQTFRERLRTWADKLILMVDLHRNSYPVDVLDIACLGDFVEGEQIFPSQPHMLDMAVIDQVTECAMAVAWALRDLLERGRFRLIRTRWIRGNHGRPGLKGHGNPRSNWDTVFARFVEMACCQLPQVEFFISRSKAMAYRIPEAPEFLWVADHGDEIRGSLGIPYYGVDRAAMRYVRLVGDAVDFFLVAHHHRQAQASDVRGKWLMNGTFVSATDFSVGVLQAAGPAQQTLLVVHPEQGITAQHDLVLARVPRLSADATGMLTPLESPMEPVGSLPA